MAVCSYAQRFLLSAAKNSVLPRKFVHPFPALAIMGRAFSSFSHAGRFHHRRAMFQLRTFPSFAFQCSHSRGVTSTLVRLYWKGYDEVLVDCKSRPEVTNSMMRSLSRSELRQQLILMHDELRCPPIVYEHFRENEKWARIIHRIFEDAQTLHWSDFEYFTEENLQKEHQLNPGQAKALVAFIRSIKDATPSHPA